MSGKTSNIYVSNFLSPPKKTKEGFLEVDTILARELVMPYEYENEDGENVSVNELMGDSIFSDEFLKSAEGLPFVLEHPQNEYGEFIDVSPENYSEHLKGSVFNPRVVDVDGEKVVIGTLKVYDQEVIDLILNKELNEVSQGYFCKTKEKDGKFKGEPYEKIQEDIILNHLALTADGRAGDAVRVLYNSKTKKAVTEFILNSKKEAGMPEMEDKKENKKNDELDEVKVDKEFDKENTDHEEDKKMNMDGMSEMLGMFMKMYEMLKPLLGGNMTNNEDKKEDDMAANMDFDDKIIGNARKLLKKIESKKNTESHVEIDNHQVTQELVANSIRQTNQAILKSQSVIGSDAAMEFSKFNSLIDFKKHVLKQAGRSEEDVSKYNHLQTDAHFEAVTDQAAINILTPKESYAGSGELATDTYV